jgi:hypothetical protein
MTTCKAGGFLSFTKKAGVMRHLYFENEKTALEGLLRRFR